MKLKKMTYDSKKSKKLIKNIVIIFLLTFLFPVGLYVMLKKSNWSKKNKIIGGVLGGIFLLVIIVAAINAPPTITLDNINTDGNKPVASETLDLSGSVYPFDAVVTISGKTVDPDSQGKFKYAVQLDEGDNTITVVAKKDDKVSTYSYKIHRYTKAEIAKQKADEAARIKRESDAKKAAELKAKQDTDKKAVASKPKAVATKSPQDILKSTVKGVVGDKLRETDVFEQVDGGYAVAVQYNASDNLTNDLIKKGIEMTMSDLYIAIFHESKQDVRWASVAAYMPLADAYGNEHDGVVYKSVLEKTEADKINYGTDKSTLELQIIPGLWNTTLLNNQFR